MRSIDLIHKIKELLPSHTEILEQISPDEITEGLIVELNILRQLYDHNIWDDTEKRVTELCQTMSVAFANRNIGEIIERLGIIESEFALLPDAETALTFIEKANYSNALLRHRDAETTIVMGDSHVNFFSGNELLNFISMGNDINTCPIVNDSRFTPLHLGPCLAYHSNSYGASTMFHEKTEYLMDNFITPGSRILCVMGEIDIRVHVFRQVYQKGRDLYETLDDIIDNYLKFLVNLRSHGYDVWVFGPIASQTDRAPLDPIYPRCGTEIERNKATAYFNDKLAEVCQAHGIGFFSIFKQIVSSNWETDERFLCSDRVHLGQAAWPLINDMIVSFWG